MLHRKVMMIQVGARRNYTYARQLEAAGLLHSLVTDLAYTNESASILPYLGWQRLARRRVSGVPASRLRPSIWPNLVQPAKWFVHEERAFKWMDEALGLRTRLRGLDGAEIVLNYHGNGGSFLEYARRRGVRILTDFVITPKHLVIERDERERWPGWETGTISQVVIDYHLKRMKRLVQISDYYLCPSRTVARDLAELPGFNPGCVRLLPYGLSGVLVRPGQLKKGRVLFAGAACLRKGLPYLSEAARILKSAWPQIEIVVAGTVSNRIRNLAETRELTFAGQLGRERMAEEFARADVFCLPSLAEGSATSVYEALANGVPVVTTPSSGSVVTDGMEGLIVPERDGPAIAEAIQRIVANRSMRDAMSDAARTTAAGYTDENCGERFIAVIRELQDAPRLSSR